MSSKTDDLRAAANHLCDKIEAMNLVLEAGNAMRECFLVAKDGTFAGNAPPGNVVAERLVAYDDAVLALQALS